MEQSIRALLLLIVFSGAIIASNWATYQVVNAILKDDEPYYEIGLIYEPRPWVCGWQDDPHGEWSHTCWRDGDRYESN